MESDKKEKTPTGLESKKDCEKLYKKLTSAASKKAADALFKATAEELAESFDPKINSEK